MVAVFNLSISKDSRELMNWLVTRVYPSECPKRVCRGQKHQFWEHQVKKKNSNAVVIKPRGHFSYGEKSKNQRKDSVNMLGIRSVLSTPDSALKKN